MKFIYVMNPEYKNVLLDAGFSILREDTRNNIYVFTHENKMNFSSEDAEDYISNMGIPFILSDMLTFQGEPLTHPLLMQVRLED